MDVLGLLSGGDLAGTDGPDGLVGDDNVPGESVTSEQGTYFQSPSPISWAMASS